MALTAALGVAETRLADTYNIANVAPNIIYELLLGGILTSIFVPVFVELVKKEGREKAWVVGSAIVNASVIALTLVAIVGVIGAPLLAKIYAARVQGPQADLQHDALTLLLRLFIPQIVFYGLTAVTAGLLQANNRFAPQMFTPVLNNMTVIGMFVAFAAAYGAVELQEVTTGQLVFLGVGTSAGVIVMALAQLPFLRGLGRYRFTVSLSHPSIRKAARLGTYVIGYAVVNHIGYFIVQFLANRDQGGYSAYVTAFTFFILPHGLFAVSIMTALLPGMSNFATDRDWDAFRGRLSVGIRATFLLLLPAAVGYLVLGEPIVRWLLERGVMTAKSTDLVAAVLRLFVIGLVPFSLFQLFARGFYAMQNTKTPFLVNCIAVSVNTAINIPLFAMLGVEGLAIGHSVAYLVGSALLGRGLGRRIGGLEARSVLTGSIRIAVAAAGMGVVVWAAWRVLSTLVDAHTAVGGAVVVGGAVAAGAVTYLALAAALRVEELRYMRSVLTRRTRARD